MNFYTTEQIKQIERNTMSLGMNSLRMMENAGSAVARVIRDRFGVGLKSVIICGRGNNGGNGFVVARKLKENGGDITVIQALGEPATHDAMEMLSRLYPLGVRVLNYDDNYAAAEDCINEADIVIDAIFGNGFHDMPYQNSLSRLISTANNTAAKKIAIDMPSGANPDTGEVMTGVCIKCDMTIGIIGLKPGYVMYPAGTFCGELYSVEIGLPDGAANNIVPIMSSIDEGYIRSVLSVRPRHCHKGDFGRAAIVAGSLGMCGASVLAARAALYSGAGLVHMIVPDCNYTAATIAVPEAVIAPLDTNEKGGISQKESAKLARVIDRADSCLIGPGMGAGFHTQKLVETVLACCNCPIIIDADGINSIAACINIIRGSKSNVILTPHPGEMARLCGVDVKDVEQNRLQISKDFAIKYGCILVLKGSVTIVALPNGTCFVNLGGNGGMASAGCGDMLAGMLAALLAEGMAPEAAARAAVYLHAEAGDFAISETSMRSLTPTMMIDALPSMFKKYETG